MGKLFKSSDYVEDIVRDEFSKTGLEPVISLKVISTTKAKEVIKVSKSSQETEFLTNDSNMVTIVVYEKAFERMDEKGQRTLAEGAVSCIEYDSEKDKISVDKSEGNMFHRMRHKYDNSILDIFESASMAIQQIEEEEKAEREAKKMAKKQQ